MTCYAARKAGASLSAPFDSLFAMTLEMLFRSYQRRLRAEP